MQTVSSSSIVIPAWCRNSVNRPSRTIVSFCGNVNPARIFSLTSWLPQQAYVPYRLLISDRMSATLSGSLIAS